MVATFGCFQVRERDVVSADSFPFDDALMIRHVDAIALPGFQRRPMVREPGENTKRDHRGDQTHAAEKEPWPASTTTPGIRRVLIVVARGHPLMVVALTLRSRSRPG